MAAESELPEDGASRRTFLRRMAVAGLVGVPVVSSFGLLSGCQPCLPGHGGNGGTIGLN